MTYVPAPTDQAIRHQRAVPGPRTVPDVPTARPDADAEVDVTAILVEMATLQPGEAARVRLRDAAIFASLPLVRRLAARFFGRGESPEDLVQVATIGLIKAIDRYDPQRGTPFASYATPTILGEIKRHFRDRGWSVRVPRPMQELYLSISQAVPEMAQELGRSPRVADLAARLGVSGEEIVRGLDCGQAYAARSLSAPVGGDESGTPLSDLLGEEDDRMESVADREALRQLLADVPERERQILALRFFFNMTQTEIAQRVGVSQMHVSRLLVRTLAELRERLLAGE